MLQHKLNQSTVRIFLVLLWVSNWLLDYSGLVLFYVFGANYHKAYFGINVVLQFLILVSIIRVFYVTEKNIKWFVRIFLVLIILVVSSLIRSQSNIPTNISKCPNGSIELQYLSLTGYNRREYIGTKPVQDLELITGWTKDNCGIKIS